VLTDMIGRSEVSCQIRGWDRYNRITAVCFKDDINLNARMVSQGWAVAFRKYGMDLSVVR
jgi:endonuclease YncB( thermonuclease family)